MPLATTMRSTQCRLVTARSELHKVMFLALSVTFLFVYKIFRERLNGFVSNSQGRRRVRSFVRKSLKVKDKGQGQKAQKTTFFGPFGGLRVVYVW